MNKAMRKPIIAAQLYTVHDFTTEASQLPSTMSRIRKAGYDSAQVSGIKAEVSASELRKIMLDSGVTPIGAHIGIEKWRGENFIQTVAYCHDLGVEYAAIPGVNFKVCMQWGLAKWKKQIREFEAIAKRALKEGIHLQYHNHDLEFSQLGIKGGRGGRNILEMVFDSTTVLQGEPDFGWVMRGGMDPALWAKRLKGRIDQVHLKDWSLIGGEFHMRALGEGRIDWPRVIRECQKGGTHTFIVEQDECPATNDPFRSLAISREYLRRIMGA